MGQDSAIQWTHHTANPWLGCQKVSPECDNCYAERGSARLAAQHGLKLWDGDRYFAKDVWKAAEKWNRRAEEAGERHRVFCASYSDVFEDREDLVGPRERLFCLIEATPHLDWLLLTKRPEHIGRLARATGKDHVLTRNVWLGTTVGLESSLVRAESLACAPPAVHKFLSMEPLLGPVHVRRVLHAVDWVIVGGESGPQARPMNLDWVRNIQAACKDRGVAFFMKQLGHRVLGDPPAAWSLKVGSEHQEQYSVKRWILEGGHEYVPPIVGASANGRPPTPWCAAKAIGWVPHDSHGGDMQEWPKDLRVREFPANAAA